MSTHHPTVQIPPQLVKELRERKNAGFAGCRGALVEASGDIEKAIAILRKKGQAAAAKKAMREASEGLVGSYIHAGGKIGVLGGLNCESDFVARTDAFHQLSHDIAGTLRGPPRPTGGPKKWTRECRKKKPTFTR